MIHKVSFRDAQGKYYSDDQVEKRGSEPVDWFVKGTNKIGRAHV